jgi:hypothetical protein
MMEHTPPDARKDVHLLGPVSRSCCRLCARCAELDAEYRVRVTVAGEEFVERLCSMCAGEALGEDLEATPVPTDGTRCEYIAACRLDRFYDRRTVEYRA